MNKTGTDSAPASFENTRWTLIRGARQLLTLRGATGPRRGPAMADLSIIPDGAVLIHDGVIEDVGTTRRVENLVQARRARELDATGKVVMPAFVDADFAIATPHSGSVDDCNEVDIRRMSRRRLESQAIATAADLIRYGVLTVGAHTLAAPDLQNTLKALRLYQALQSKPLRICSIFSPPAVLRNDKGDFSERIGETWMPAIFRRKLASTMEIPVAAGRLEDSIAMASSAAANGYNIRFRAAGPIVREILELAYSAGAIAVIGTMPVSSELTRALADVGCINIILTAQMLGGDYSSERSVIDDGIPVALASGYGRSATGSMNPQFLLHLACQALKMTVEEAIVATTYNAAYSLRLSHVTGSLAPGKSADICVMDVDDYHELANHAGHHDLSLVMRSGKILYRRTNPTLD